jgi:hypothetical protein
MNKDDIECLIKFVGMSAIQAKRTLKWFNIDHKSFDVEVGQNWIHHSLTGDNYVVVDVGILSNQYDDMFGFVTFKSESEKIYTKSLKDFIESFVRLS